MPLCQLTDMICFPGSKLMKNWESEASGLKDRDFRLGNVVQDINDYYDFVLFDTPPFFGVSTTSTLLQIRKFMFLFLLHLISLVLKV